MSDASNESSKSAILFGPIIGKRENVAIINTQAQSDLGYNRFVVGVLLFARIDAG